jgi:cytoskeleton protein RodZ
MTESNEAMTEARTAPRADGAAVEPPSCGRILAEERERQGISVVDMAARLRLHPKQIAAIEADDLDRLPGGPFVRGFVRNYAKELRLDPAPLLEALRERLPPVETGVEAAASGTSQIVRDARREWVSRRVVLIGAVGALVALGVVGWFSTRSMPPAERRGQAAIPPAPAAPAAQTATEARPTTGADLPAQGGAPVSATPTAQVEPIIAAAPAAASPIRLAFRERAWVEVTQADGRVLLSQNNDAGSEQKLDGKPPFKLVIGNASAVTLEYRGRPVDLKPLTSVENVARVTLE